VKGSAYLIHDRDAIGKAGVENGQDQTSAWVDDTLDGTDFLAAHYVRFAFPPHVHETFAIGVIETGGQRFRPERRSPLVMPAGTLCVIDPGTVHEGRAASEEGWRYRMFYPATSLVKLALAGLETPGSAQQGAFSRYVIDDPGLYTSFLALHAASEMNAIPLERETRAVFFLTRLFGRHAGLSPVSARHAGATADVVRAYLHAHCTSQVRLEDLAAAADVSTTHVVRSFTRAIGMPPHAYLIGLRVERAKSAIRLGHSLADAALVSGFGDQSQLTRHFRSVTGMTPGYYARQVRGAR
jgi:AraC-like DNA-binding protein